MGFDARPSVCGRFGLALAEDHYEGHLLAEPD